MIQHDGCAYLWRRLSFYEYRATSRLLPLEQAVVITRRMRQFIPPGLVCIAMSDNMCRLYCLHTETGGVLVRLGALALPHNHHPHVVIPMHEARRICLCGVPGHHQTLHEI